MNLQQLFSQLGGRGGGRENRDGIEMPLPDTSEQIYISSLALLKMLKHGKYY